MIRNTTRRGLTLVDAAVLIAVVGLLGGMALPGVQKARATAARSTCEQNLRRLGTAVHAYADANADHLPYSHRFKAPLSGWATLLLPHLGEEKLYRQYDWELDWVHPDNQKLAKTHLAFFECPATPDPDRLMTGSEGGTKYAVPPADYFGVSGFTDMLIPDVFPPGTSKHGAMPVDEARKRSEIPDGLSTTLIIGEDAGRPQVWQMGVKQDKVPPNEKNTWAAWNGNYVRAYTADGKSAPGPCAVNCNNVNIFYSFHDGGAYAVVADGSVRFLKVGLDVYVMYALVTREGGELVSPNDF
ncbi:DUF1559 domain-containing protein [Fimbriiglobus ruber]|uniref:DUF1559 domain-containing protein n=1 Tax=Fimbriiglobus ruber TaxID=1908690 RepID=A0A225DF28_9BACT|nr:DUF1559 domain-containing protein [Fimbriiglobus ruber]OWK34995.1 hypothetical protein FRUB_09837 [Fimbriiglobus ruber]